MLWGRASVIFRPIVRCQRAFVIRHSGVFRMRTLGRIVARRWVTFMCSAEGDSRGACASRAGSACRDVAVREVNQRAVQWAGAVSEAAVHLHTVVHVAVRAKRADAWDVTADRWEATDKTVRVRSRFWLVRAYDVISGGCTSRGPGEEVVRIAEACVDCAAHIYKGRGSTCCNVLARIPGHVATGGAIVQIRHAIARGDVGIVAAVGCSAARWCPRK